MRQDESDETLMQSVASGDRQAFRRLVERHAARAHAVAQRLLYSKTEAEDAVQDVCMKLWVHAASWDPERARFSTWFYRMLTNGCIDRRRRKRPLPLDTVLALEDTGDNAEQQMVAGQKAAHVRYAVSRLPDRQQTALALCYFEGFSNQEAAEIMGLHIKALEGLLVRARKTLRYALAPLADER